MPLPEETRKLKWPPELWDPIYQLYAEHAAWYSGDPEQIADVYSRMAYIPTPKGRFWARQVREERRTMLHIPIAGDIASTSADLLFSEHPRIFIPEAHKEKADAGAKKAQDRLDFLVERGQTFNKLLEGAESCAAIGGVYLKVDWDETVADHPFLSVVQADCAIPEFRWGVLQAITLWRTLFIDGSTYLRHLERHEPGIIYHGLYQGTADLLGKAIPLEEHNETRGLPEALQTGVDKLIIRYVPNIKPNRRFRSSALGRSDYDGCEGLMDSLDEVYTSWVRDIRLAAGRLIVPETWLKRDSEGKLAFDMDQEVFTALEVDPLSSKDFKLTNSQFEIRADEHQKTSLELLDRIISSAGYSPQSFGLKIEGRAESGTALTIRERKSFITRGKKENYWRPVLEELFEVMAQIDYEHFDGPKPEFRASVELQDSVQQDMASVSTAVEMLRRAQAASTQTLVMMLHPDWTPEEIKEEVKKIQAENGQQVEDPFQVGKA